MSTSLDSIEKWVNTLQYSLKLNLSSFLASD